MRQSVMPILIHGQHLHRNVAGRGILLQMVEHGPAEHVRQGDIERHGGGVELPRKRERFGPACSHKHLEALVA